MRGDTWLRWCTAIVIVMGTSQASFAKGGRDVAQAAPMGVTFIGTRYGDANGMTLYVSDKPGCDAICAQTRMPAIAPSKAKPVGPWTLVKTPGGRQWAFKGSLVYTSSKDDAAGKANGIGDGWQALSIDPADGIDVPAGLGVREINDVGGRGLVDSRHHTLYALDAKVERKLPARSDFVPVPAALIAHPVGDFSVVRANDGSEQWAYKGKPLFSYAGDERPGHARGEGVDPRWHVALVARHFMPEGVIIRTNLGFGPILANANGTALYIRDGFRFQVGNHHKRDASRGVPAMGRSIGLRGCVGSCLNTWKPLVARAGAQPSGYWGILTHKDGIRQWSYQGYALYSFVKDKNPGDMIGNDVYDITISEDPNRATDDSMPMSLNWHVAFP